MSIFDQDFDMKQYIEKRLLEMQNLESRRLLKDVTGKLLQELYDEAEGRFTELEQRILGEVPVPAIGPAIITGIASRETYDLTDEYLYPMRPEDLADAPFTLADIAASLKVGNPFPVKRIFLAADAVSVRQFMEERSFPGILRTNHGEVSALFRVASDVWYREQVQRLYPVFQQNFFRWRTVCMPYLYKLFEVSVVLADGLDAEDELLEVCIDFGRFQPQVREGQVPLWNISSITEKTSTYPEPCMDKTNYEHRIFRHRFPAQQQFLVAPAEPVIIRNIRWEQGDLIITAPDDSPVNWRLYAFHVMTSPQSYENPLMTNRIRDTFAARLRGQQGNRVRTRTEICRILAGFELEAAPEFIGTEICPNGFAKQTYAPDAFIVDEIRTGSWPQALRFSFRPSGGPDWLDLDKVSFLTGVMQEYFPEYECCGQLV